MQAKPGRALLLLLLPVMAGCSSGEIRPVEIYEEDACSQCRMAISDHRFAGEIITADGEVFKFDDLGCMKRFTENRLTKPAAASFVMDYATGAWYNRESTTIVKTGIATPMSSGLVAFADPEEAARCVQQYPPEGE